MVKKIKHVVLNRPKRMVASNDDPTKGTQTNPYTQEEFYAMLDNETWTGGWVEGMGYALPAVDIVTSFLFDFSWDSWDLWSSWSMYDSWNELNLVIPFSVNIGGGGNGSGQNGAQGNIYTITVANSVIATNNFVASIQNALMDVPQQLWYLLRKIKFDINQNSNSRNYAYYSYLNKTIYINPNGLNAEKLTHEMIHALQHDLGYMNDTNINTCHYNFEYEAYVLCDILRFKKYGVMVGMTIGSWKSDKYLSVIMHSFEDNKDNPLDYSYFSNEITNETDLLYPFLFNMCMPLVNPDYDEERDYPNGDYDYSLVSYYITNKYSASFTWHWNSYFQIFGIETK